MVVDFAMEHSNAGVRSVVSNLRSPKDEDTEALAGFLLSLKHRSVTPEPQASELVSYTKEAERCESSSSCSEGPVENYSSNAIQALESIPRPLFVSSNVRDTVDLVSLLGDSKLVQMEDRDLVPDPLFAAMAQMKPCRLTHADRVGCYKSREIGFLGMCCMHCGGQPGFGRYYPNSVRSLAQTTTSQTILKHISVKCRYCPPHIRNAVLELQRLMASPEGFPLERPRYGSRKIFFQRVWHRLHGTDKDLDEEEDLLEKNSISGGSKTPSDVDENVQTEDDEDSFVGSNKRKLSSNIARSRKRPRQDSSSSIPTHVAMA